MKTFIYNNGGILILGFAVLATIILSALGANMS